MLTIASARRAAAALAAAALSLSALPVSAATTFTDTDLTVDSVVMRVMSGSEYESLNVVDDTLVATLRENDALIVRTLLGNQRGIENDVGIPACHVVTGGDNQLIFTGPRTVTLRPGTVNCSTANSGVDRTPFVTVNAPNGGETVKTGDVVSIFWGVSNGTPAGMRVSLTVDGGATWTVLADALVNNGYFMWTVPDMPSSSKARVRVDALESLRVVGRDVSDAMFSIEGTSPEPASVVVEPYEPGHGAFVPEEATRAAITIDVNQDIPDSATPSGSVVCTPGIRLKGPGAAVYYCGKDAKRHPFPTLAIHNSWYTGFDGVVEFTDSELAQFPLGAPVTYRPGVRLVKVQTDPKVYAVDANGTLRWIPDEWIAKKLYGDDWNTKVDDLSDAFFSNYTIGDPIPTM